MPVTSGLGHSVQTICWTLVAIEEFSWSRSGPQYFNQFVNL